MLILISHTTTTCLLTRHYYAYAIIVTLIFIAADYRYGGHRSADREQRRAA